MTREEVRDRCRQSSHSASFSRCQVPVMTRAPTMRSLFERIEALQQSVNDFQCEFEGSVKFKGKNAETTPVDADGMFETFSGTYIWQRGGDVRCETLHRKAVDGQMSRHTLVMRASEKLAYYKMTLGHPREVPNISKPTDSHAAREGLGELFPLSYIGSIAADANYEITVSDGQLHSAPVKVLRVGAKGFPNSMSTEYFIDLARRGHVVRNQSYIKEKTLSGWFNIELGRFAVNGMQTWMPVSGESVGLMAVENGRPILTNGPTSIRKFQIVRPTMEFNKHPGPDVFSTSYASRPPVSEGLRKLEDEFARQVIRFSSDEGDTHETIAELPTKLLGEKAEAVVVSAAKGIGTTSWIAVGFGALVAIATLAIWMRRRTRSASARRRADSNTKPC